MLTSWLLLGGKIPRQSRFVMSSSLDIHFNVVYNLCQVNFTFRAEISCETR